MTSVFPENRSGLQQMRRHRHRHHARLTGRRLRSLTVALAVVSASLVTWGPTLIETSTASLTAPPHVEGARPVADRAREASATRTTRVAPVASRDRADRGTRPLPVPASGAPDERNDSSAAAGSTSTTEQSPADTAPEVAAPGDGSSPPLVSPADNPVSGLADMMFYGPNTGAARAAEQSGIPAADAALLTELARVPTAIWLGRWSGDVASAVRQFVADARAAGAVPVFVVYNIPGRDCGGYSAGGELSAESYARWVQGIAAGIGTAEAVVVVEPDALAQLCADPAAVTGMLRAAVDVLERNPGTHTYLDAGHADWIDAPTMAERLRAAGVAAADGFALNVSNFGTTASNVSYGRQVSSLLGGAHFVVDTSRNGNGPGSDWCNPAGRAVGERPTARTGHDVVDAYLWIKTPGESDGTCNGGPAAGVFWPEYALGLMRAAF